MTRDVYTLGEDEHLALLLETLKTLRFRHAPVTDGENLVGLLTERDLLSVSASSRRAASACRQRSDLRVQPAKRGIGVLLRADGSEPRAVGQL